MFVLHAGVTTQMSGRRAHAFYLPVGEKCAAVMQFEGNTSMHGAMTMHDYLAAIELVDTDGKHDDDHDDGEDDDDDDEEDDSEEAGEWTSKLHRKATTGISARPGAEIPDAVGRAGETPSRW